MLTIRLQRVGRVHEPTFRVVVMDSKFSAKSGKALDVLGSYDPREGKGNNHIDAERAKRWIKDGAQVSETVHNLLVDQKVITGKKINVLPKNKIINAKKAKEAEAAAKAAPKVEAKVEAPAPVAEAPKEEVKAEAEVVA